MNREILFKAKRKDNGEWVEGYLMDENYINVPFNDYDACGRFDDPIEIDQDTLCQFTGVTDKNGKKIWENDILKLPDEDGYFKCEWEEDTARFVLNGDGLTVDFDNYWEHQVEVLGNIFDNAELLEVE